MSVTRSEILDTAKKCVCGDRDQDYGSPEKSFDAIASMWTSYLYAAGLMENGDPTVWKRITPKDVAAMMVLFKIARVATGHNKSDNWIDFGIVSASEPELFAIWLFDNDLFRLMPFGKWVYWMKFQGVTVNG